MFAALSIKRATASLRYIPLRRSAEGLAACWCFLGRYPWLRLYTLPWCRLLVSWHELWVFFALVAFYVGRFVVLLDRQPETQGSKILSFI